MKKRAFLITLMCLVMVLSLTGCVKVVQIGHEGELTGDVAFNAEENIEKIWDSQAVPEYEKKAVDLPQFLTDSSGDFTKLADKHGNYSMGNKGELSYVVKGQGKVTEVNREKKAGYAVVQLEGYSGPEVVKLQIGSVYRGTAARDCLSLIKYEDYKNQVEWAKVSQSIHGVVSKDVIGKVDLDQLQGKKVTFVGCFSVVNGSQEILVTPVMLKVE